MRRRHQIQPLLRARSPFLPWLFRILAAVLLVALLFLGGAAILGGVS